MSTKFIIAYEVEGATYTCKVDAPNWEAAERHLIALASTGRVSGEHVCDVPEVDDTALLRQALDTLAYWLEHGETPGAHDMIQRAHDILQERLK